MAVNEVLNQLQGLIRGGAAPLIEVSGQLSKDVVPFVPGERFTAKVLEQVANGRFLVQIRDQTLDLNLPRNTQPGQSLELRFVSATPRLTFVLAEALSLPAGSTKTPVNLSDGARYLNALLDRVQTLATQAQVSGKAQTAPGLQIIRPVLEGAPLAPGLFAAALKEAVSKSGLFYESHQAQWAAGEKPLADILREPQGRLSEARAFANSAAATGQGTPADPAQAAKVGAAPLQAVSNLLAVDGKEPVHPQTAPLVQQQLDVLDTRQLVWQGQVWPGQELRWQIEERAAHEGTADAAREWQTQLNLHLPNLGEVNALLKISPQGGIRIALTAHSPEVAQTLRVAGSALNKNLELAGLQLIQLEVAHDG